jgi:hypothetical protein
LARGFATPLAPYRGIDLTRGFSDPQPELMAHRMMGHNRNPREFPDIKGKENDQRS